MVLANVRQLAIHNMTCVGSDKSYPVPRQSEQMTPTPIACLFFPLPLHNTHFGGLSVVETSLISLKSTAGKFIAFRIDSLSAIFELSLCYHVYYNVRYKI